MKRLSFFAILLLFLCGCSSLDSSKNDSTTRFVNKMDTVMTLTVYGANRDKALDAAEAEITRLDELLSTENPSSEIALLNQTGSSLLSDDSCVLISKSLELYKDTGGIFDITVYPLTVLWGFPSKEYRVPMESELEDAMLHIGSDKIQFSENDGFIKLSTDQAIDLGGIAKGYTSQRIIQLFKKNGVESAIVSLGGNVQCLGRKPDGKLWNVGIRDPWKENGDIYAVVAVADKAVITSGGYERFFVNPEDGKTYRHILDPRTGCPAESDLASVTIITENGTLGDGLSTSLYIMGLHDAVDYWMEHSSTFDAIFIESSGNLYITDGIKESISSDYPIHIISAK